MKAHSIDSTSDSISINIILFSSFRELVVLDGYSDTIVFFNSKEYLDTKRTPRKLDNIKLSWGPLRSFQVRLFYLPLVSSSFIFKMDMKASCGTSTDPTDFIRFLPAFCFSNNLRFRVISPP